MAAEIRVVHHDTGKTDIFVGEEEILTLIEELADEIDSMVRYLKPDYPTGTALDLFNRAHTVLEES